MFDLLGLRRPSPWIFALFGLWLSACSQAPVNRTSSHQIPESSRSTSKAEHKPLPAQSVSQSNGLLQLLKQHFGSAAVSAEPEPEHLTDVTDHDSLAPVGLSELNFDVVEMADSLTGVPYRSGGTSPKGFDCSGLVYYIYAQLGIKLPRSSREQMHSSLHISDDELQPGDLLFFKTPGNTNSHVGIYTGNRRFIHAPSRGKVVSYSSMEEPYWRKHYVRAGRVFN